MFEEPPLVNLSNYPILQTRYAVGFGWVIGATGAGDSQFLHATTKPDGNACISANYKSKVLKPDWGYATLHPRNKPELNAKIIEHHRTHRSTA
ncbi:hypothetical protein VNO77_17206 [Canavalia gladiata]|uniref:Uncharacterized protein n=1 Tax=Canavalia gladiata TaxID=3824 RepID=A0AAN9LIJ6_CANGL